MVRAVRALFAWPSVSRLQLRVKITRAAIAGLSDGARRRPHRAPGNAWGSANAAGRPVGGDSAAERAQQPASAAAVRRLLRHPALGGLHQDPARPREADLERLAGPLADQRLHV